MEQFELRFLCVANSIRSQMAEGVGRKLADENFSISSAGSFRHRVDEDAIQVMNEIGIDISQQKSKGLDDWDFTLPKADLVVDLTEEGLHHRRFEDQNETLYLNVPLYDPVTAKKLPDAQRLPVYRYCRAKVVVLGEKLLVILKSEDGVQKLSADQSTVAQLLEAAQ